MTFTQGLIGLTSTYSKNVISVTLVPIEVKSPYVAAIGQDNRIIANWSWSHDHNDRHEPKGLVLFWVSGPYRVCTNDYFKLIIKLTHTEYAQNKRHRLQTSGIQNTSKIRFRKDRLNDSNYTTLSPYFWITPRNN